MENMINYAKIVASSAWMYAFGNKGEFRELSKETVMVIPGALSENLCKEMITRIDQAVDDPLHPRTWVDATASDRRIFGFEREISEIIPLFEIDRWIAAVDYYTGRKTKSWFLMANRVVTKPNNLGSGGGLHRDSPFSHQVKCIWYLSDVTKNNGPFQYIPGTHNNLLKNRHQNPLGKTRFDRVEGDLIEVIAEAGSLLICDTKCIHGGKPIESGARYAITLYTLPNVDGAKEIFRKSGIDPELAEKTRNF